MNDQFSFTMSLWHICLHFCILSNEFIHLTQLAQATQLTNISGIFVKIMTGFVHLPPLVQQALLL